MGGKPSKNTSADRRLKENKNLPPRHVPLKPPAMPPPPMKGGKQ